MPRLETSEGEMLDLLPVGTEVTHKYHTELRGKIICYEYHRDGRVSPLPYKVYWTDTDLARELLGTPSWLYPHYKSIIAAPISRFFLTVDWCNQGKRGIFCNQEGTAFPMDGRPHSEHEMWEILGAFDLVLNPQSIEFTEEELKEFNKWYPLAEYTDQYGYAVKPEVKEAELCPTTQAEQPLSS